MDLTLVPIGRSVSGEYGSFPGRDDKETTNLPNGKAVCIGETEGTGFSSRYLRTGLKIFGRTKGVIIGRFSIRMIQKQYKQIKRQMNLFGLSHNRNNLVHKNFQFLKVKKVTEDLFKTD